jgi:sugar/nucleoside kinase (ribokinase family)
MGNARLEVLHLGSACRDVAPDDPRGWRLGGGVTYAALTTARLGLRTAAVIGVDAEAIRSAELDLLRAAGVQLLAIPLSEGPIFDNRETPSGRVQTCIAPGVPMPVVPLPDAFVAAEAWSFTPVAGEIGEGWARVIPDGAFVALGWQGFLRELVAGEQVRRSAPRASALLRRADLVGVSHHDVDPTTSLAELTRLLKPGADLLVTRGEDGGLLVRVGPTDPARVVRYRQTHATEVDPTGAGDTFLAALTASVLRPAIAGRRRARRAPDLRFAAAAGSLAVERVGLDGVPDRAAVNVRRTRETIRRAVVPTLEPQVGAYDADGDQEG